MLLRIKILFEQGLQMTSQLLASIQQVVRSISIDLNTITAGQQILKELRTIHPGIKGIELRLSRQAKDVLLVQLHKRVRGGRKSLSARLIADWRLRFRSKKKLRAKA